MNDLFGEWLAAMPTGEKLEFRACWKPYREVDEVFYYAVNSAEEANKVIYALSFYDLWTAKLGMDVSIGNGYGYIECKVNGQWQMYHGPEQTVEGSAL